MAWTTSTIAEAYRLALVDDLVSPQAVDGWLDGLIAAVDSPSPELIDASVAANESVPALVAALAALAPGFEPELSVRGYFRLASDRIADDASSIRTVTRTLEQLALDHRAPSGCEAAMLRFDDAMSLARGRVYGTEDEVLLELRAFLAQNSDWPRA